MRINNIIAIWSEKKNQIKKITKFRGHEASPIFKFLCIISSIVSVISFLNNIIGNGKEF